MQESKKQNKNLQELSYRAPQKDLNLNESLEIPHNKITGVSSKNRLLFGPKLSLMNNQLSTSHDNQQIKSRDSKLSIVKFPSKHNKFKLPSGDRKRLPPDGHASQRNDFTRLANTDIEITHNSCELNPNINNFDSSNHSSHSKFINMKNCPEALLAMIKRKGSNSAEKSKNMTFFANPKRSLMFPLGEKVGEHSSLGLFKESTKVKEASPEGRKRHLNTSTGSKSERGPKISTTFRNLTLGVDNKSPEPARKSLNKLSMEKLHLVRENSLLLFQSPKGNNEIEAHKFQVEEHKLKQKMLQSEINTLKNALSDLQNQLESAQREVNRLSSQLHNSQITITQGVQVINYYKSILDLKTQELTQTTVKNAKYKEKVAQLLKAIHNEICPNCGFQALRAQDMSSISNQNYQNVGNSSNHSNTFTLNVTPVSQFATSKSPPIIEDSDEDLEIDGGEHELIIRSIQNQTRHSHKKNDSQKVTPYGADDQETQVYHSINFDLLPKPTGKELVEEHSSLSYPHKESSQKSIDNTDTRYTGPISSQTINLYKTLKRQIKKLFDHFETLNKANIELLALSLGAEAPAVKTHAPILSSGAKTTSEASTSLFEGLQTLSEMLYRLCRETHFKHKQLKEMISQQQASLESLSKTNDIQKKEICSLRELAVMYRQVINDSLPKGHSQDRFKVQSFSARDKNIEERGSPLQLRESVKEKSEQLFYPDYETSIYNNK